MKFNNNRFDENQVRLRPIAVELRVRNTAGAGNAAGFAPTWWQRIVLALARMVLGTPAQDGFDDRRSRKFPVPCFAQNEVRIPAPAATIVHGPSARIIPFPQKNRRTLP